LPFRPNLLRFGALRREGGQSQGKIPMTKLSKENPHPMHPVKKRFKDKNHSTPAPLEHK
jgi:hypothetical protein